MLSEIPCVRRLSGWCFSRAVWYKSGAGYHLQSDAMKAMVTGGPGFLGSHIVERLLAQGFEVCALARSTSFRTNLESTDAQIITGDLLDCDSLRRATKRVDVVLHTAAKVAEWGAWSEFEAHIVQGTKNLLQACVEAGVPRFLYVSSIGVYGEHRASSLISEDLAYASRFKRWGYYNWAKIQGEQAALSYQAQGKISVSIVRLGWLYGPRDRTFLPRLIQFLASPFRVWVGRTNPRIPLVYVADAAEGAILAATQSGAVGRIYNLCPEEEIRFRDFISGLAQALGIPAPTLSVPYSVVYAIAALMESWAAFRGYPETPSLTRSALGFLTQDLRFDASRAKRELGWVPRVSLREGTRASVEWLLSEEGQRYLGYYRPGALYALTRLRE